MEKSVRKKLKDEKYIICVIIKLERTTMILMNFIALYIFRKKYRKMNAHNQTHAINMFDINHVEVGKATYGGIAINDWSVEDYKVRIGNYCSIGPNVLFLLGSDHYLNTITTYPLKVKKMYCAEREALSKGDIVLKDDVWIGANVTICSGVEIGQGAIVAAGAVVTKDVEPYAVVGGVPAKLIKYRFPLKIVKKLLSIRIVEVLDKVNNSNISLFYRSIDESNVDEILIKMENI
ncbi:MAG: CatB-related O-acetyltransferase [Treponema sp.]|nr:CatB-related O-acetyltransferase [Treponema sp.]